MFFVCAYCGLRNNLFIKKFNIYDKYNKKNTVDNMFFALMSLLVLFSYCVMKMVIFERVSAFVSIFTVVVVPNAIENIDDKYRNYVKKFLLLVFVLYFLIIAIYRPNWSGCIPYEFYFE